MTVILHDVLILIYTEMLVYTLVNYIITISIKVLHRILTKHPGEQAGSAARRAVLPVADGRRKALPKASTIG